MSTEVSTIDKIDMRHSLFHKPNRIVTMALLLAVIIVALVWRFFDRALWWWLWGV